MDTTYANRSHLSRTTANVVMVLLSLSVCLVLLELGLRIYSGVIFPKMMVIDKKLGWRHASNVSRTFVNEFGEKVLVTQNAYGHRGKDHNLHSTHDFLRVLALGDSFTEGVQVDDTEVFTAQLEQADSQLQVLNAGVGGYGTVQEYLYLASEGLNFESDLVLLMFYNNDLTDNGMSYYPGFGPRPYARLEGDDVRIIQSLDSSEYEKFILPAPFRMALNNHSYFYYFANSRIYQRLFAGQMLQLQQADLQKLSTGTRFKLFFKVLEEVHGLLAARRIPLLAVLIPSREEVARGSSDSNSIIEEYCRRSNISCLSLLDRFRIEAASGVPLYFPVDMHWTKVGHKVAADEILKYIRSLRQTSLRTSSRTMTAQSASH